MKTHIFNRQAKNTMLMAYASLPLSNSLKQPITYKI